MFLRPDKSGLMFSEWKRGGGGNVVPRPGVFAHYSHHSTPLHPSPASVSFPPVGHEGVGRLSSRSLKHPVLLRFLNATLSQGAGRQFKFKLILVGFAVRTLDAKKDCPLKNWTASFFMRRTVKMLIGKTQNIWCRFPFSWVCVVLRESSSRRGLSRMAECETSRVFGSGLHIRGDFALLGDYRGLKPGGWRRAKW